jgi:arginyl-tRNA synthetase
MEEMYNTAKTTTETLGKIDSFDDDEKHNLFTMISLGALKYYILKVDPKKTMLFNPEESIDFNGNTGPFIQYTHARIRSLFRKAAERGLAVSTDEIPQLILPKEKDLIKLLHDFPAVVHEAAENLSPAQVANYVYDLAKEFNQFYQEVPVLKEENPATIAFRLALAGFVGSVIKTSMNLLGIEVPEKM